MKLQPDRINTLSILSYGPGWLKLVERDRIEKIEQSIVVGSRGEKFDWGCQNFEQLTEAHFAQLAVFQPELVIFGSGTRLRFPAPALLKDLMAQRIGLETMDTPAACRTFNILAAEGRRVIAALLIDTGA